MSALFRLARLHTCGRGLTSLTSTRIVRRGITTSSKKDDDIVKVEQEYPTKQTWVSHGFDREEEHFDRFAMHCTLFCTITMTMVFGAFLLIYNPDQKLQDWSTREAYLQLRYREENGLPLIDPNVVDPARITLPTDEELKEMPIVI